MKINQSNFTQSPKQSSAHVGPRQAPEALGEHWRSPSSEVLKGNRALVQKPQPKATAVGSIVGVSTRSPGPRTSKAADLNAVHSPTQTFQSIPGVEQNPPNSQGTKEQESLAGEDGYNGPTRKLPLTQLSWAPGLSGPVCYGKGRFGLQEAFPAKDA